MSPLPCSRWPPLLPSLQPSCSHGKIAHAWVLISQQYCHGMGWMMAWKRCTHPCVYDVDVVWIKFERLTKLLSLGLPAPNYKRVVTSRQRVQQAGWQMPAPVLVRSKVQCLDEDTHPCACECDDRDVGCPLCRIRYPLQVESKDFIC